MWSYDINVCLVPIYDILRYIQCGRRIESLLESTKYRLPVKQTGKEEASRSLKYY